MRDQQPTARIFLARHGEADYESDLVTDQGGTLSATGRAQAQALARSMQAKRVARVWCSPLSRAVQTAEIVAASLGVDVVVREGLREYGVGSLAGTAGDEAAVIGAVFDAWVSGDDGASIEGGERVEDIVHRVAGVLEGIAEEHRGDSVLVVSHGGAIMATVPWLLGLPRTTAQQLVLPGGVHLVLEHDTDGWRHAERG